MVRLTLAGWVALVLSATHREPIREEVIAYKFGRILTVTKGEIKNGIILVEKGKIQKIGADIRVPDGAKVIDLSAFTVIPGLVDGSSYAGISGAANENSSEITPDIRILDSIDPKNKELRQTVQLGITSFFAGPGDRNVIGGLASVLKPVGSDVKQMVIREDVALKAAMGSAPSTGNFPPRFGTPSFFSRRPTTRMGVVWEFRKAFFDARKYKEERPAKKDEGKEVLLKALDKKLPVRISASRAMDIESALRLADEFEFSLQIEEAQEAYRHVDELARKKVSLLLRPTYLTSEINSREGSEVRFNTFATLTKAGVKVALLPQGRDPSESLLATAAFTTKFGGSREEVLKAVTIIPAEILGVSERVGSLEEGKDADFVVLSGDPLDLTSRIEWVFVDGKLVFGKKLSDF